MKTIYVVSVRYFVRIVEGEWTEFSYPRKAFCSLTKAHEYATTLLNNEYTLLVHDYGKEQVCYGIAGIWYDNFNRKIVYSIDKMELDTFSDIQ